MSRIALVVSLSSLVACAGDGDGPIDPSSIAEFGAYCTGRLTRSHKAMKREGPNVWHGTEELEEGTVFLLGESFDKPDGYVIHGDDTVSRLSSFGFDVGAAFETSCASTTTATVLLTDSTFFATSARSGDSCRLPRGTVFTSWSFQIDGDAAEVTAPEVESSCGFNLGHTADVTYAHLYTD